MPTHREGKNSSESTLIFGKAVYKPDTKSTPRTCGCRVVPQFEIWYAEYFPDNLYMLGSNWRIFDG